MKRVFSSLISFVFSPRKGYLKKVIKSLALEAAANNKYSFTLSFDEVSLPISQGVPLVAQSFITKNYKGGIVFYLESLVLEMRAQGVIRPRTIRGRCLELLSEQIFSLSNPSVNIPENVTHE